MNKNKLYLFTIIICITTFFSRCLISNKKEEMKNSNYIIDKKNLKNFDNNLIEIAVIGGGPAAFSAGLYGSRLGKKTAVFVGENYGGQLMGTGIVENWPGAPEKLGTELMANCRLQSESFGGITIEKFVSSINTSDWPFKIITADGSIYYALTVIMATGSNPKMLNCKGENEFWGKGVSSCAICDAPLYEGKDVIVVGGGDSACEEVIQLVSAKVKSVKMLIRSNKMRASNVMKEKVKNFANVEILYNIKIQEIVGNKDKIQFVICEIENDKKIIEKKINTNAVFIAIGHTVNSNLLFEKVDMDKNGLIICKDRTQSTTINGIYAAGDVCNTYRQAIIACGEGVQAALEAFNFIEHDLNIDEEILNNEIYFIKKEKTKSKVVCEDGVCKIEAPKDTSKDDKKPSNKKNNKIKTIKSFSELKTIHKELNDQYYLIDFYTNTCPNCVTMLKTLEEYVLLNDSLNVFKMDAYTDNMVDKYNIRGVPAVFLMKGEKIIEIAVGYRNLENLKKFISKNIKKKK